MCIENEVMCMHCLASQKFLRILCAVVAETAELVPSYEAGWQHCLAVFSTSVAM